MAPQLPTRQLNQNGPQVTVLGFGLMGQSAFYGTPQPGEERFEILDAAYNPGERIRTLPTYTGTLHFSLRNLPLLTPGTSAVQIDYSPFAIDIEPPQVGLLKTCRDLGVAIVAYSSLGRGMLTGAYKSQADLEEGDSRKYSPRFSEDNFPENLEFKDKIAGRYLDSKKESWLEEAACAEVFHLQRPRVSLTFLPAQNRLVRLTRQIFYNHCPACGRECEAAPSHGA
ncbi:MAG: hypothetical protein Q9217_003711 [Psora testacea]